jgi:CheY-like chemotaxis protein
MHAKAIMVVDDDKDIVRAVRLGLENTGSQVHDLPIPFLRYSM